MTKTLLITILFVILSFTIISCGSTSNSTSNKLAEQNADLAQKNKALKEENLALKAEIKVLRDALPKPVEKIEETEEIASQVPSNATSVYFESDMYHFGKVKPGEQLRHVFKFKNTGNHPLTIKDVKTSCGCTITKWNKNPIPVGETGEIGVSFDTTDKSGEQTQTIIMQANTSPVNTKLTIKATIL